MGTAGYRILIVDDDAFVLDMMVDIFSDSGHSPLAASDGSEALKILDSGKVFDLLISDMNMPGMDGLELLREVRKRTVDLPVIILTGNEEIKVALDAMNSGADGYLLKDEHIQDTIVLSAAGVMEKYELKRQNQQLLDQLIEKNREIENSLLEVRHAYDELKKAQAQILQQEKMASIGQLAAGVAHEINNPMGFITTNIKVLSKYISKLKEFIDAQHEAIVTLNSGKPFESLASQRSALKIDYIFSDSSDIFAESLSGAERVVKIVQDLKNFSNVDAAEEAMNDLNACIDDTLSIMNSEFGSRISVIRDFGNIPPVIGNRGQLNQVFLNILRNSVQAIENKGEIRIKTNANGSTVMVYVSDNGTGIPSDVLPRIFDPFFTTKPVGKGQGLGLSVAYDIVKKHGGSISAESVAGQGSTLTISLPVGG